MRGQALAQVGQSQTPIAFEVSSRSLKHRVFKQLAGARRRNTENFSQPVCGASPAAGHPRPPVVLAPYRVSYRPAVLGLESLQLCSCAGFHPLHNNSFKPNPLRGFALNEPQIHSARVTGFIRSGSA